MDTPTPEELVAEKAATQVPKEEEIRAEIITEYGFDPDIDGERIDKLTKRELESRSKLSDAIGQKIKHRTTAEELAKKIPKEEEKKDEEGLSQKDLIALMKADVAEEDIDDVVNAAKVLKLPVSEALKNNVVKTLLSERTEERKTAEATATGNQRRAPAKVTGDEILAKASKGELPEDDAGIAALTEARMQAKLKK